MGKFNEYTQKATPEDADTLMIYDAAAKSNKLSPFSGIWNWIVGKLTNAVISNLATSNKTVIGALNELNSKLFFGENITDNGNVNNLFEKYNGVIINSVYSEHTETITGFPKDAYGYGRLITISGEFDYVSIQIYVPHDSSNSLNYGYIFVRMKADGSTYDTPTWRRFEPKDIINAVTNS